MAFTGQISYLKAKVDTWDEPLGNFAPVKDTVTKDFAKITMPTGMLAKLGTYYGEGQFVDAQNTQHMRFMFKVSLGKDWGKTK